MSILSFGAGLTLALVFFTTIPFLQAQEPSAVAPSKLSRTVGLDIVQHVVNPDNTISLTFHWSEKGHDFQRTVVATDQTIVVYNGHIMTMKDLTDDQYKAKAVATVKSDGTTVVLLRFGKKPLPKNQLTPAQRALLASLAPAPTAASDTALDHRVESIIQSLNLSDAEQSRRVSAVLEADLRAVRDAHNSGLELDPSVHQQFIEGLAANLTPDQVEMVKDKLTLNKMPITFKVYQQIIPNLKPSDKARILSLLGEAREKSLDQKNVDEMTPIFKKYKLEIQKYLESQGYDWNGSYKAFVQGQKAKPSPGNN